MDKLRFIFKSDEEVVIDKTVEYKKTDEYFSFSLDNVSYKIKLGDSVELQRATQEEIFKLRKDEKKSEAIITLKNERLKFDIKVNSLSYDIVDKKYTIKYNIESTEGSYKTIVIEFV